MAIHNITLKPAPAKDTGFVYVKRAAKEMNAQLLDILPKLEAGDKVVFPAGTYCGWGCADVHYGKFWDISESIDVDVLTKHGFVVKSHYNKATTGFSIVLGKKKPKVEHMRASSEDAMGIYALSASVTAEIVSGTMANPQIKLARHMRCLHLCGKSKYSIKSHLVRLKGTSFVDAKTGKKIDIRNAEDVLKGSAHNWTMNGVIVTKVTATVRSEGAIESPESKTSLTYTIATRKIVNGAVARTHSYWGYNNQSKTYKGYVKNKRVVVKGPNGDFMLEPVNEKETLELMGE